VAGGAPRRSSSVSFRRASPLFETTYVAASSSPGRRHSKYRRDESADHRRPVCGYPTSFGPRMMLSTVSSNLAGAALRSAGATATSASAVQAEVRRAEEMGMQTSKKGRHYTIGLNQTRLPAVYCSE